MSTKSASQSVIRSFQSDVAAIREAPEPRTAQLTVQALGAMVLIAIVALWLFVLRSCRHVDQAVRIVGKRKRRAGAVDVYTIYIEDDRYSVPTIDILMANDDAHVQRLAAGRLISSPHYIAIEVWQDERIVSALPNAELEA